MNETAGAALLVSSVSAVLLAFFGVDYYSVLWATFGAATTLLYSPPTTRRRAVLTVLSSSLLGAALGTWIAEHMGGSRATVTVASLVCASGPQLLVSALLNRFVAFVGPRAPGAADNNDLPKV